MCDRIIDCRDGADIRNCTGQFRNVYYLRREDIPVVCPDAGDSLGVCVSECEGNDDCDDGEVCCFNGCGHTCREGIQVRMKGTTYNVIPWKLLMTVVSYYDLYNNTAVCQNDVRLHV